MYQRGIRGAITLLMNTPEEITYAVTELIPKMLEENSVDTKDISHVIFSMTEDINAMYPAKTARENIEGFNTVPMFCVGEQKIKNSLPMCLRVLMVVNTELKQEEIKHIYLREAKKLRTDITNA